MDIDRMPGRNPERAAWPARTRPFRALGAPATLKTTTIIDSERCPHAFGLPDLRHG